MCISYFLRVSREEKVRKLKNGSESPKKVRESQMKNWRVVVVDFSGFVAVRAFEKHNRNSNQVAIDVN